MGNGRAVRFDERTIRTMGRVATGVRGMKLDGDDDAVVGMIVVNDASNETVMDFLKLGTQDLDVLRDVCVRYGKPVPRQIKMVYDAKTHGFDSKISYDSLQKENKSAGQAFMDWRSEVENRN